MGLGKLAEQTPKETFENYGAIPFDIEDMPMLRWIDAR